MKRKLFLVSSFKHVHTKLNDEFATVKAAWSVRQANKDRASGFVMRRDALHS